MGTDSSIVNSPPFRAITTQTSTKEIVISPDVQLVDILEMLVQRFGARRTLGETYATSYALKVIRAGGTPSIADIATATGCSKQNLSRWLHYQVDIGQARTRAAEDDARKQAIAITDPMWAYRHLQSLTEIIGCDLDLPRQKTQWFNSTLCDTSADGLS